MSAASDRRRSSGFTLIELIVLILAVGIAGGTVFTAINYVTTQTPDVIARKQAMALAESIMDEIVMRTFGSNSAPLPVTTTNRTSQAIDVDDYNGFAMNQASGGIRTIDNQPITGLDSYGVSVAVADVAFGPAGQEAAGGTDARRITVTVTGPRGLSVVLQSFRLRND